MPTIEKITPPNGKKQLINIHGDGFPIDESRVSVYVGGKICSVKKSLSSKIMCYITEVTAEGNFELISGAGWQYERHTLIPNSLNMTDYS